MKYWAFGVPIVAILLFSLMACPSLDAQDAQEGSVEETKQLSARVVQLYGQAQYEKAIPLAQRVLAIREKLLGPEHPYIATSLNNLALLYEAIGAYEQAEPLLRRALAMDEKMVGPDHPDTARSLNNLASLYYKSGAYAMAEPLLRRALEISEKTLGPEHPDTAQSLNNLAELYRTIGAYGKAEPLFERALAINEKALGPMHPYTATMLNNFALLYEVMGEYARAEGLCRRALAINEKTLGPEHPATAMSLNNLADLYRTTGAYAKAEPLYQRALAINEKTLGPEHPDTAKYLTNLALSYLDAGEYAPAETLYQRALAIKQKTLGPEHPSIAISLINLAALYEATGAYGKAEPLYRRALAINEKALGPEHPETANSLNSLAGVYYTTREYANAEPLVRRALAINEKALGPERPETANSLNNLAALYLSSGAYPQAEPLLRRALVINEKALGPEHPDTANSLNTLAGLYGNTGEYKQAESLYQRALAINEKALGPEHPNTVLVLNNLAGLYEAAGAYAKAEAFYQRAQNIEEKETARFLFSGSEARKQAYLQRRIGSVSRNVTFSLAHPTASRTALGLSSVLQYKGRVLDATSDSISRIRHSAAPEDQALFDQLSSVAQELSTLTFGGLKNLSPEAYRERLRELAREQDKLEAELSTRSAALRQAVTPITLEGVRHAFPENAVLVEWFRYQSFNPKAKESTRWGAPRYVAYVLRRRGEPAAIDMGAAQPIDNLVAEFRSALSDSATANFKVVGGELYKALLQPLRSHLANTKRVLLSPDGALNLLPFAALTDKRGQYLTQQFELTYVTSGRDLLRIADEPLTPGKALIVANPNYGTAERTDARIGSSLQPARSGELDRSGMDFSSLPGTAAEAKLLQSLLQLDDENVLTGDRATEASLRTLHGPRILHVATHGFFLNDQDVALALTPVGFGRDAQPLAWGENPLLRSGLALAGANARHSGTKDDGILTAAEVAQLDLVGTQLVVLSACDTGIGTVQSGEGVYGLRRALVLAGAQAQMVSLWDVADVATQELMQDYYQRLLKGEGRSQALRASQLAMLANPQRQHPYYWAGFIPIGQWTPLTPGR
jgi:CHAT domain-containing protein/Tfp pilus assembly protein PilF